MISFFEDDNRGNCGGSEKTPVRGAGCLKDVPDQAARGRGKRVGYTRMRGACAGAQASPAGLAGDDATVAAGGPTTVGGVAASESVASTSASVGSAVAAKTGRAGSTEADAAALDASQERGATTLGAPLATTGAAGIVLWLVLATGLVASGVALMRVRAARGARRRGA